MRYNIDISSKISKATNNTLQSVCMIKWYVRYNDINVQDVTDPSYMQKMLNMCR